jgi:hypothetical protein
MFIIYTTEGGRVNLPREVGEYDVQGMSSDEFKQGVDE